MAWADEINPMVRYLINDTDSTDYLYDDTRLNQTIVISAQFVNLEVDFDYEYTISIAGSSITPDPTDPNRDNAFINLVALKTACVVLGAEAKLAAGDGIRFTDGPSTIDTLGRSGNVAKMAELACGKYQEARINYVAGNSRSGAAIMTPYTNSQVSEFHDDLQ